MKPLTKSQVAESMGVCTSTLQRILNKDLALELKETGYRKNCKMLTPKQIKMVYSHWGCNGAVVPEVVVKKERKQNWTKKAMVKPVNSLVASGFAGFELPIEEKNGIVYVNATELARHFSRRPANWLELPSTKEFINAVIEVGKSDTVDTLIVTESGGLGGGGGTWFHKSLAIEFARWLNPKFGIWCNDRIEEYLKHGVVASQNFIDLSLNNPEYAIQLLQKLQVEREEKRLLEVKNKKLEFRSEYVKVIADSENLMEMSTVSKVLQLNIGRNLLFKYLRDNGIFFLKGNEPQQRYVDLGYFVVKYATINIKGNDVNIPQTFATNKGVMYIYKHIKEHKPDAIKISKEALENNLKKSSIKL